MNPLPPAALLLVCCALAVSASEYAPPDRVLASSVSALTFRAENWATRVRSQPVPALRCTGPHCSEAAPDTVQCTNVGTGDDGFPQWKCQASIRDGYELGRTSVVCEGYDRPGDSHMRRGSCSLDYTIRKTAAEAPAGASPESVAAGMRDYLDWQKRQDELASLLIGSVFVVFVVVLLALVIADGCAARSAAAVRVHPPVYAAAASPVHVASAPPVYMAPAPPQVYVQSAPSTGFWSGYLTGSLWNRGHSTTTIVEHHRHSAPVTAAASESRSREGTHTSTSHSGTTML